MAHLVLQFLTAPWPYVVALTMIGFFIVHRAMRAAVALWLLAGFMIVQNCSWTFAWMAAPLIAESNQLSLNTGCLDSIPLLVILGGGIESKDKLAERTSERIHKAAEFLREKPKTVIFSGGPTLPGDPVTEAALGERDLRRELGDKAGDLKFFREERSLTTYQNALRTRQLVEEKNLGHQVILVTSVFHMPRAAAVFSAQGFEICALPSYPASLGLPSFVSYANAMPIAALVHEYFGYWYYGWRGWIH